MEKLVYAECSVTFQMLEDKLVLIISDTGIFMVTTEKNSKHYNEEFYPIGAEAMEAYGIRFEDKRLVCTHP
jgi:hypothetical protein